MSAAVRPSFTGKAPFWRVPRVTGTWIATGRLGRGSGSIARPRRFFASSTLTARNTKVLPAWSSTACCGIASTCCWAKMRVALTRSLLRNEPSGLLNSAFTSRVWRSLSRAGATKITLPIARGRRGSGPLRITGRPGRTRSPNSPGTSIRTQRRLLSITLVTTSPGLITSPSLKLRLPT